MLQIVRNWREYTSDGSPLLLGRRHSEDTRHLGEGQFQWHPLPNARYSIDGHYRRPRHRHPMVVLRNQATGEHFIAQLAWSAGYTFEFDLDADCGTMDRSAVFGVSHRSSDGPAPLRMIEPGETVTTPEVHMGMVFWGSRCGDPLNARSHPQDRRRAAGAGGAAGSKRDSGPRMRSRSTLSSIKLTSQQRSAPKCFLLTQVGTLRPVETGIRP